MLLCILGLFLFDQADDLPVAGFLALDLVLIEVPTGFAVALIFGMMRGVLGIHVIMDAVLAGFRGVGGIVVFPVVVIPVILLSLLFLLRFIESLLAGDGIARSLVFAILHP